MDGDKGVHAFLKGISPKVNVIALLEFKLAYFEARVQHLSHYTIGTPASYLSPTVLALCEMQKVLLFEYNMIIEGTHGLMVILYCT